MLDGETKGFHRKAAEVCLECRVPESAREEYGKAFHGR